MSNRLPLSLASAVESRDRIVIRQPLPDDDDAIQTLADLTDRPLPTGGLLVAEVDGELVAVAGEDGSTLGDPFRVTLDVVELLELRARQLRSVAA
jgi:predicted ATP-grasp superfamily ATP-dependent carboligase